MKQLGGPPTWLPKQRPVHIAIFFTKSSSNMMQSACLCHLTKMPHLENLGSCTSRVKIVPFHWSTKPACVEPILHKIGELSPTAANSASTPNFSNHPCYPATNTLLWSEQLCDYISCITDVCRNFCQGVRIYRSILCFNKTLYLVCRRSWYTDLL